MSILAFFRNHHHYWGIPHTRTTDNRLIQTCYECSAERQVKIELRPSHLDYPVFAMSDDDLAA
jgi:hypothetical protein